MSMVAARTLRARAAVRPDRGAAPRSREPIVRRHGRRGHAGRPRRPARHHRRPAGHRPRLQDAHRPGRRDHRRGAHLPGRRARRSAPTRRDVVQIDMDADGMRIDAARGDARPPRAARAAARSSSTRSPPSRTPRGVTMSLPRRRRLVEVARERELLVLEDNPYGLLRYEGEPLPTLYSLDGGEFVIYLRHVLQDPLPRRPRWAGRRRRAPVLAEDERRQAGHRPLLVVDDAALRGRRTSREGRWRGLRRAR